MKLIQGQNLFTIKSLSNNKPEVRPEIKDKLDVLLETMEDGQVVEVDNNGDVVREEDPIKRHEEIVARANGMSWIQETLNRPEIQEILNQKENI